MPKKLVKTPKKLVKTPKKLVKTPKKPATKTPVKIPKKPSKKPSFKLGDVSTKDILLGAGAVGGLVGIGYATVIAPKLKKKRLEVSEAKDELEIKDIVTSRIRDKAKVAKEKVIADMEKITETYSAATTPKIEKIKEVAVSVKKDAHKFTSEQRQKIVNILKKGEDVGDYIGKIIGRKYIPSSIKLSKEDPVQLQLHVIEGSVGGYSDSDISRGLEKLRNQVWEWKQERELYRLVQAISEDSARAESSSVDRRFKLSSLARN